MYNFVDAMLVWSLILTHKRESIEHYLKGSKSRSSKQTTTIMNSTHNTGMGSFVNHPLGLMASGIPGNFSDAGRVYRRMGKSKKSTKVRRHLSEYLSSKYLDVQSAVNQVDRFHEVWNGVGCYRQFVQELGACQFQNPDCKIEALQVTLEMSNRYIELLFA